MGSVRRRSVWAYLLGLTCLAAGCSAGGQRSVLPTTMLSRSTTTVQTPSSTSRSKSTGTPATVQNLVATSAVKAQLTATYVAFHHLSATDVSGTFPGSVYYAFDPTSDAYWAMATFEPSKSASEQVAVNMQDEDAFGLFTRMGDGPWTIQNGSVPLSCAANRFFPQAVLHLFGIPAPPPNC